MKYTKQKLFFKYVFLLIVFFKAFLFGVVVEDNDNGIFVNIDFTNEPLLNIVRSIATAKKLNILLPQSGIDIKEKITLKYPEPFNIDEAWKLVLTLLDLSDYTVLPKSTGLQINKKNVDSLREPVPLFVNTPLNDLPDTENIIRYLYFFSNIKVPVEPDSEMQVALKELLSTTGMFKIDQTANAVLLQDKAGIVSALILFIQQFDQPGYQEKIEAVHLVNTEAKMIADLLNEYILKISSNEPINKLPTLDNRKLPEGQFFGKGTKVIPITHNNTLLLLGRPQVVDKIKDFILNTLDQAEQQRGKSILHVLPLQYVNADQLAPVLQRIVDASKSGGTGQSTATSGSPIKGGERLFDEIIIRADKPQNSEESKYYGGNNLIIACRNDDFEQIKQLVLQIDIPQPIVLFEIVIADLTIEDTRKLGTMMRNPANMLLPSNMNIQSAQLDSGILLDNAANPTANPTTLAVDLLEKVNSSDTNSGVSIASLAQTGSTLLSFNDNDGKTWGLLQVLKMFSHSKVISQPHVVTVNNKPALIRLGSERLLDDDTTESSGGSAIIKKKKVEAVLQVDITPRISPDNTVTLQIKVSIDDFLSPSNPTKITREVSTSANVSSGSIFSLGGLTNLINSTGVNETPGLSKIPVIGRLFSRKSDQTIKNNLTVFISPTIIQPRLRKGANTYTKDCIALNQKFLDDSGLFTQTKDPITRWFFKNKINALEDNEIVKNMVTKVTSSPNLTKDFIIEKPVVVPPVKDAKAKDVLRNELKDTKNSINTILNTAHTTKTKHVTTPNKINNKKLGHYPTSNTISSKENTISNKKIQMSLHDHAEILKGLLKDAANPFFEKDCSVT
ncbi:hypothetical protein EKK58_03455 [Candidatus Dependentiae bacterium]|nr:MAG: hypothetical protein EKK58_03455 [Candidatus Dependentiae bacterium]